MKPVDFTLSYSFYLAVAILLDVIANILIKLSDGFNHKKLACVAIICVLIAFTAFSFAIRSIQLSIAYSIWGGLGLIFTSLLSKIIFKEEICPWGWFGIGLVISGVLLMRLAHLF